MSPPKALSLRLILADCIDCGGAGIHSEPVHINCPSGLNIGSDITMPWGITLRNARYQHEACYSQNWIKINLRLQSEKPRLKLADRFTASLISGRILWLAVCLLENSNLSGFFVTSRLGSDTAKLTRFFVAYTASILFDVTSSCIAILLVGTSKRIVCSFSIFTVFTSLFFHGCFF